MRRLHIVTLCAALAFCAAAPCAEAQSVDQPAAASGPAQKRTAPSKRRKASATPPRPAAAQERYELVPSGESTSALTRARRNAFGTRDEEAPPPGYRAPGKVGVGLGGSNGMTPGMAFGF